MRVAFVALVSCALTACALSPQAFSDGLRARAEAAKPESVGKGGSAQPASHPITVAEAKADIATVQWRYLSKVTHLSQLAPTTSAALIGISAVALYKALTNGNSKDIIGLGVLGSGVWALGTTLSSRPRQAVYLEGARALSCVATLAEPYDVSPEWTARLRDQSTKAAKAAEELRGWRQTYASLTESRPVPGSAVSAKTCAAPPQCAAVPANADEETRGRFDKECKKLLAQSACKPTSGAAAKTETASPVILAAFQEAEDEQTRIERAVSKADRLAGTLAMAGPRLWDQSVGIQLKVSAEVLKTEPDPTSVLATVKNLPQVAGVISGTTLPSPRQLGGTGQAQGGVEGASKRAMASEELTALNQLKDKLTAAYQNRVDLERMLTEMDARVAALGGTAELCEFKAPGSSITVMPFAEEIQVPLGSEQPFSVSGGSGIPVGEALALGGAKAGALVRSVDGSTGLRFVYTVPTAADGGVVGDKVMLVFKDGSGQAKQTVTVAAVAARPASGGAPAPNTPKPEDAKPKP